MPNEWLDAYMITDQTRIGPFIGVELKVIGSFTRQSGEEQIYCPLPADMLDFDGYTEGEVRHYGSWRGRIPVEDMDNIDAQTVLYNLLNEIDLSSASFKLKDARELKAFKDFMEQEGFSGPKQDNSIRVAVMLRDSDFSKSMSNIHQRSRYMEILYPVLLALAMIVGLITSFLMVNGRREEAAIMRGMGAGRGRIFLSFFIELAVLTALGVALGALIWRFIGSMELLERADPYLFAASYALGGAAALIALNLKKALAAISERE